MNNRKNTMDRFDWAWLHIKVGFVIMGIVLAVDFLVKLFIKIASALRNILITLMPP